MARFLIGDELGNIKTLRYTPNGPPEPKCVLKTIHHHAGTTSSASSVQQLVTAQNDDKKTTKLGASFSDGSIAVSTLSDDDKLEVISEWKEPRLTGGKFIGSALRENSMFTCTSNGMLRKTQFANVPDSEDKIAHETRALPSRLADWKLADNGETFAYAGDEVDLSVWDTNLAFSSTETTAGPSTSGSTKKRKRNEDLFPGEIWRARNVPNDHLGLRQPIRFTALTYLDSASNGHHLVAGTQFGDVRRYDTRAARRPVSNWTGVGKVGGVGTVLKGNAEHELFISDKGSNLYSIDLRAGNILYGYKGLSGAVISTTCAENYLASVALDRFCRIHSTAPPPATAGRNMDVKGAVLEKTYITSVPTVIVWDGISLPDAPTKGADDAEEDDDDEDDVWENMEHVS